MTLQTVFPDAQADRDFKSRRDSVKSALFPPPGLTEVLRIFLPKEPQTIEIVHYLERHPYLVTLLKESIPHVHRVFGDVPTYLDLHHDPEGGPDELFVVILVRAEPERALELLRRFDQEWFIDAVWKARGRMNFTVKLDDDSGTL